MEYASQDLAAISGGTGQPGYVVAWGVNDSHQCVVPSGKDFVAIAAGDHHSLAIRSDGSLVAWGYNYEGECNVPSGNNYVGVSGGGRHSMALKSDGSIVAWGDNTYGQCGVPAGNDYAAIAAGSQHSLALKTDGSLIAWGDNKNGLLNVPAGNDFVAIAAGFYHNLALRSNGSLVAWGASGSGQCNVPTGIYVDMAGGYCHSVALRSNGSLVAFGWNASGQCNVPAGNDYSDVAAGVTHSLALRSDGSLVAWGSDDLGQCDVPVGSDYTVIAAGGSFGLALSDTSIPTHAVTASTSGGSGSASPNVQTVFEGATASIYFYPQPGFHLASITDNGVAATPTEEHFYMLSDVMRDHDVVFFFEVGSSYTVNASVSGTGGLVSPPSQTVSGGGDATINFTPLPGYHVLSITDNGKLADPPYSNSYRISNVTENHNVVVTFSTNMYLIKASVWGGGGSVSPASQTVFIGSNAAVNISSNPGYHIASITDNGVTKPLLSLYIVKGVTQGHNVVVTFAINTYTVTASAGANGSVSPASQTVAYGGSATINISPAAGYHIASITDNSAGKPVTNPAGMSYIITGMAGNHSVVATFAINTYTVTAAVEGGHGAVSPDSQPVDHGNAATINISPETGYHIATITDNGGNVAISDPAGMSYVISGMAGNHAVVVTFAANTYSVTASAGTNGSVSPPAQTVDYGGTATINISPVAGYHVASMTDNGSAVPSPYSSTYVISGVDKDHTVVVTFAANAPAPPCGSGSGTAFLALGLTLGLLAVAGKKRK